MRTHFRFTPNESHPGSQTVLRNRKPIAVVNKQTEEIQPYRRLTRLETGAINAFFELERRRCRARRGQCGDFVSFAERLFSLPDTRGGYDA
jgi:hypothetical protein